MKRRLGDCPTMVTDAIERFHHRRPIVVALEIVHLKSRSHSSTLLLLAAVFLDMQLLDSFSERANPLFGPAVRDDIADIEMPADVRGIKLVHVTNRFERTQQKMVPNIFDGDF